MAKTKIEWADTVWNPVSGCTKVSEGCRNCYAEREWTRLSANPKTSYYGRKFNEVACHPERLDQPLRWKKPRRIFVNSMSDLFHEDVPDEFIFKVFNTMVNASWINGHTFLVLTKRPERMKSIIESIRDDLAEQAKPVKLQDGRTQHKMTFPFPLRNIWLGVSVENQAAVERIAILKQIPAAGRFISFEPLLGEINLTTDLWEDIDWAIVGGESGPKARSMHPDWVRSLRDQCQEARVPFFFKQWGEWFVPEDGAEACRVCGCTWNNACDNGCHWVEPGLCSNCVGKQTPDYRAVKFLRIGKKQAGREIDGRTWDEMPERMSKS